MKIQRDSYYGLLFTVWFVGLVVGMCIVAIFGRNDNVTNLENQIAGQQTQISALQGQMDGVQHQYNDAISKIGVYTKSLKTCVDYCYGCCVYCYNLETKGCCCNGKRNQSCKGK